MAWWNLEWIKLKKKRTQKFFRKRKIVISPEKIISNLSHTEPAENDRLFAPQSELCNPALSSTAKHFSESEMKMSRHYQGVLKITNSELEHRSDYAVSLDVEAADGRGRFSRLWPAMWGGTKVCVKTFDHTKDDSSLLLSRIASNELAVLSELRHPALLCLMGVSFTNTYGLQLVFENIPFGSLYHALHIQQINFSIEDICRIFIKLIEAVRFMHQNSWLHLGLSSHAIQLTANNQAKVSSFELAKQQNNNGCCRMSAEDVQLQEAIINWQAPEQCLGETVGPETDMYSLTVLLQEAITGKVPWERAKAKYVRRSYASGTALDNHGMLLSSDTHGVLQRGLAVHRADRNLSLNQLEELCNKHLGSNTVIERRVFDFAENVKMRKKNRSSKLFSFGAFKRHLSSCQSCAFNTSSPDPLRKSSVLGKLIKKDYSDLEVPEEIYFDDHFDASVKLGTHLQLLPRECVATCII